MRAALENRARRDCWMADGQTPLALAAEYGHVGVLRLLLERQASVSLAAQVCDAWLRAANEGLRARPLH